jgi:hypothetical protein
MLIQGANNPLVIQFDDSVDDMPTLVVTLWCDAINKGAAPVKTWTRQDMMISGDTAVCDLTEEETAALPTAQYVVEVKGLDPDGNTIFWDECKIDMKRRRDKIIRLGQEGD